MGSDVFDTEIVKFLYFYRPYAFRTVFTVD